MRKLAPRLKLHLEAMDVAYDVLRHRPTATASATAAAAHVPGGTLLKAVLLRDERGQPLLAVLASTQHVDFDLLEAALGRRLALVPEAEIGRVFVDCAVGALPPTGAPYGIDVVVDTGLEGLPLAHLEAGDHRHVLRIAGRDLERLWRTARRANFAVAGPPHADEPAAVPHPRDSAPTTQPTEATPA